MHDYNDGNDSKKVAWLKASIFFVSILLIVFGFLAVIDLTKKESLTHLTTTTRRTTTTKLVTSSISTDEEYFEEDNIPDEDFLEDIVDKTTTNQPSTSSRVTTTTKVMTTTQSSSVIPSHTYEVATGKTTYKDAVDSYEWEIINLINAERKKNGLNELIFALELRTLAEEAATLYSNSKETSASSLLSDYAGYLIMYKYKYTPALFYNDTVKQTKSPDTGYDITTNPYYKYIGVGVIEKANNKNTYYYALVYE